MSSETATYLSFTWTDTQDEIQLEAEQRPAVLEGVELRIDGAAGLLRRNPMSNSICGEDEVLLEQVREKGKEALAILFRRYARLVRAVAYRILRSESEAEDLLQEVFLFVFRKAALFDASLGSARSWIVQITYHRAIDRRRQLISRHFYDAVDLEAPAAAALHTEFAFYEQSLEGTLGKEVLSRIRESLSEDQRRTLELCFFEGYTIEEIAQETGQSPGNVRHHYYRALEKIRKLVFHPKLASR